MRKWIVTTFFICTVCFSSAEYQQQQVQFRNGEVTLAGTLTLPMKDGQHPAVVLVTGSGSQDRNSNIFGFKIFAVIADHLTRHGIAVLRYDDRGVGGSTGNMAKATTVDFAEDALAAVDFLKKRKDINHRQIGILGHSEGGMAAIISTSRSQDIAFMILMAGVTIPGDQLILEQLGILMRVHGVDEKTIEARLATQRSIFQATRAKKWEKAKTLLRNQALCELKKQKQDITEQDKIAIEQSVKIQMLNIQSPWFYNFVTYQPARDLEKIKCPVLALFGSRDLQVPAETNSKALVAALNKGGNSKYKIELFEEANHLFQKAKTGSPQEYPSLEKKFVAKFLDTIAKWITAQVDLVQ